MDLYWFWKSAKKAGGKSFKKGFFQVYVSHTNLEETNRVMVT